MKNKYPIVIENTEKNSLEVTVKETECPRFVECINEYLEIWRDHETDEVYGFEILHFRELMGLLEKAEKEREELTEKEKEEVYQSLKNLGFEQYIKKDNNG